MATLRITIKGTLGQISADAVASVLTRSLSILHDLDTRLSEQRGGSLRWVVSGGGEGSFFINLAARPVKGDTDHGPRIHDTYTNGLQTIREDGVTPPYFSVGNVTAVRNIVRDIGRDGISAVQYSELERPDASVELDQQVQPALEKLVGESYHALGSIEGKIELVSIRKRRRRFNVTLDQSLKTVECNLPADIEDPILDAMKQHRRILVKGRIAYNARNEPMRVSVQGEIRLLGERAELPNAHELAGSDPDFTGDMSTEDYVRSLRDG